MIPTTDEMDSTTPEERNKLVGECMACGHWTHFTRTGDIEKCEVCGSSFRTGSIISQRTFNPLAAKRKGRTSRR